jgi:hypothetical protein
MLPGARGSLWPAPRSIRTHWVPMVGLVLLAVVTASGDTPGAIQDQLIAGGAPPGSNNPLAGGVR